MSNENQSMKIMKPGKWMKMSDRIMLMIMNAVKVIWIRQWRAWEG